jgi:hypothetical protein
MTRSKTALNIHELPFELHLPTKISTINAPKASNTQLQPLIITDKAQLFTTEVICALSTTLSLNLPKKHAYYTLLSYASLLSIVKKHHTLELLL